MAAASEQLDNPLIDDLEKKVNKFESQFKDKISQIEQKLSPVQKDDQQIAEIGEVDTSIGEVNTRLKKQDTDLVTKNQAVTYFNNSFVRKLFNVFTGEKTKLTQNVKIVTEDIINTNNQLIEDINQKGNLEKMVTSNLDKNIAVCDQVKSEINVPKAKLSELSAEYDVVEDKTKELRDVNKHRREQLEKISGKLNVMEQKVEDLERNVQGWKGKHEKFKEELPVRKQEINQLKENAQQRVEKLSNRGDKQDQMQNSNKTNRTSRG